MLVWVFGYTFPRPYFSGGYLCYGLLTVLLSSGARARAPGAAAFSTQCVLSHAPESAAGWVCSSCPVLATWQGHICAGRLAVAHGLVVQLPALTCPLIWLRNPVALGA